MFTDTRISHNGKRCAEPLSEPNFNKRRKKGSVNLNHHDDSINRNQHSTINSSVNVDDHQVISAMTHEPTILGHHPPGDRGQSIMMGDDESVPFIEMMSPINSDDCQRMMEAESPTIIDARSANRIPSDTATATAQSFRVSKDFVTGMTPKHFRGDTVWVYRRKENVWKEAIVVDTRSVITDGHYIVSLEGGHEVEAYDQTMVSRSTS